MLGELDSEQKFVGTDGWFGEFERVLSFEINGFLPELDRLYLVAACQHRAAPERVKVRALTFGGETCALT